MKVYYELHKEFQIIFFYFFIKEGREKKSIFKSREDNWLSIRTTPDFVPTSVAAGDEKQFKLGSCSDIIPLSCHLKNTVT